MSTFNPYRHLNQKVQALLRLEAKMSAEEREANQWQLLVKFCGSQLVVGKGGVNTCFFILGANGTRKVCYPDALLSKLQSLAENPYWRYEVLGPDQTSKFFWTEAAALERSSPVKGSKLYGLKADKRVLLKRASQGLHAYEWK
jgi:hypothetical protein